MPTSDNCHGGGPTAERDDCYVAPLDKAIDPGPIADGAEARLHLAGLGCTNCVTRVRNALLAVDGVIAVDVSLQPQRAVAIYDPSRTLPDLLIEAVLRSAPPPPRLPRRVVECAARSHRGSHRDGA